MGGTRLRPGGTKRVQGPPPIRFAGCRWPPSSRRCTSTTKVTATSSVVPAASGPSPPIRRPTRVLRSSDRAQRDWGGSEPDLAEVDRGELTAGDLDSVDGGAGAVEDPVGTLDELAEDGGGHGAIAEVALPHTGVDGDRGVVLRPEVDLEPGRGRGHRRHDRPDVTAEVGHRRRAAADLVVGLVRGRVPVVVFVGVIVGVMGLIVGVPVSHRAHFVPSRGGTTSYPLTGWSRYGKTSR